MNKDEALRLALEALEKIAYVTAMDYEYQRWAREAITAIKAALEAKDEPDHSDELTIAYMSGLHRGKEVAQRTWVGLTDEDEIDWEEGGNLKDLVKAIEAKLKQKNGNA
jgi:hypothetical protein